MVTLSGNKNSLYYTIDFEDFTYDYCRSVSSIESPYPRTSCMYECYENLTKLLIKSQQKNKYITFFCTGVVADRYPELIRKIASDGHEIACHGDFHDNLCDMSPSEIRRSLLKAKDKLSSITNTSIKGFRAPRFSVNKNDISRLKAIAGVFEYDSSLHFSSQTEFKHWQKTYNLRLKEIPVPHQPIFFTKLMAKPGGTFLKLLPYTVMEKTIAKSFSNEITPIIYLHPYDIYFGYDMCANWKELIGCDKRLYRYLRQFQWVGLLNWSQERKLTALFNNYQNLGCLCEAT